MFNILTIIGIALVIFVVIALIRTIRVIPQARAGTTLLSILVYIL